MLNNKRAEACGKFDELLAKHKEQFRKFKEEGRAVDDAYKARALEMDALSQEIERYDALIAEEARLEGITPMSRQAAPEGRGGMPGGGGNQPAGPFRSLGEQLQAVCRSMTPGHTVDRRLLEMRAPTGVGELVGEQGGFAVQTDLSTAIWKRAYETGQVLSRVRRIPVGPNANGIKHLYLRENARTAGNRYGGVQVYRRAEAATVTASRPLIDEYRLELEAGMALVYLTDEIIADAPQMEALVREVVPEAIRFALEDEIINANGAGRCLGVLNAPSLVQVPKEVGQAAASIVSQNIMKADSRIWEGSVNKSVWFVNQDVKPQLYGMTITGGVSDFPVYMPPNGLSAAPFGTLFGRPVIPIEHCPTLGTLGDILSADLSQYVLIEKGGVNVASSIHVQFLFGEQVLRFMWRNNGAPYCNWAVAPLTPAKGTATKSPFVAIATRA